jgi:hypothetical protein
MKKIDERILIAARVIGAFFSFTNFIAAGWAASSSHSISQSLNIYSLPICLSLPVAQSFLSASWRHSTVIIFLSFSLGILGLIKGIELAAANPLFHLKALMYHNPLLGDYIRSLLWFTLLNVPVLCLFAFFPYANLRDRVET